MNTKQWNGLLDELLDEEEREYECFERDEDEKEETIQRDWQDDEMGWGWQTVYPKPESDSGQADEARIDAESPELAIGNRPEIENMKNNFQNELLSLREMDNACVIVSAVGPSGSGKTFWMESFEHLWPGDTVAIVPHHRSFEHIGPLLSPDYFGRTSPASWPGSFRILQKNNKLYMRWALKLVESLAHRGRMLNVVMDDLDCIGKELQESERFHELLRQCRWWKIRLFLTALRIVGTHMTIRCQPTQWIIFRPENPTDLNFYMKEFGISRETILGLPAHHYIEKNPGPSRSMDSLANWVLRPPISPTLHPSMKGGCCHVREAQVAAG